MLLFVIFTHKQFLTALSSTPRKVNLMKQKEVLIVRSSVAKSLYDVVEVDYFNESFNYIEKAVTFEEAQGVVADHTFFEVEVV
jgi:hypothetical protein